MGSGEVLGFAVDRDGDAYWFRHCPVAYPPIAERSSENKVGSLENSGARARSRLALRTVLGDVDRLQSAALPGS